MLHLTNAKIILHLKYRYFLHLEPKKRFFFNLEFLLSDLSFIPQSTEILILLTTLHKSTFKCQIPPAIFSVSFEITSLASMLPHSLGFVHSLIVLSLSYLAYFLDVLKSFSRALSSAFYSLIHSFLDDFIVFVGF